MHVNPALRVFELANANTTTTASVRRKVACIKADSPFAPVANPPSGSTDLACLYASHPR
jgi:hypothetical protein